MSPSTRCAALALAACLAAPAAAVDYRKGHFDAKGRWVPARWQGEERRQLKSWEIADPWYRLDLGAIFSRPYKEDRARRGLRERYSLQAPAEVEAAMTRFRGKAPTSGDHRFRRAMDHIRATRGAWAGAADASRPLAPVAPGARALPPPASRPPWVGPDPAGPDVLDLGEAGYASAVEGPVYARDAWRPGAVDPDAHRHGRLRVLGPAPTYSGRAYPASGRGFSGVRWTETATHRVKTKYRHGRVVGRWEFARKR